MIEDRPTKKKKISFQKYVYADMNIQKLMGVFLCDKEGKKHMYWRKIIENTNNLEFKKEEKRGNPYSINLLSPIFKTMAILSVLDTT